MTAEVSFYFYKNAYTPFSPSPSSGTLTLAERLKKVRAQAAGPGKELMRSPPPGTTGLFARSRSRSRRNAVTRVDACRQLRKTIPAR